jgi:Trk K+ transport system NAD-binding subunit
MKHFFMLELVFEEQNVVEPSLVCVFMQPNSSLCGLAFSDIELPEKCAFLGILREEEKVIPATDNPTIYPEDYILAVAIHPMMTPALKVTLKKTHPVYYSLNTCLLKAKPVRKKFADIHARENRVL